MEEKYRLLLAVGNDELEEQIRNIPGASVVDSDLEIDIITDILDYETVDYVIVNTVLSKEKSLELAKKAKEKSAKVIALIESHKNKELIAALVGFGVKAFIQFDEIPRISAYIKNYPERFDFGQLQEPSKNAMNITRPSLLNADMKGKIFIGVFNICSGAGATSTAVEIAESIANSGYPTICISLDGSKDLQFINQKKCKAEYVILEEQNLTAALDLIYSRNEYRVVLFDFGKIYDIDASGELRKILAEKEIFREFLRCGFKIGMSFSDAWHEGKLKFFEKNKLEGDFNIILSGLDVEDVIKCYPMLDLHNRDVLGEFVDGFKEMIGVLGSCRRKERILFGLRKKGQGR